MSKHETFKLTKGNAMCIYQHVFLYHFESKVIAEV